MVLALLLFLRAQLPLALLERSFGPQCVDFSLAVVCLLLALAQRLHLQLLLLACPLRLLRQFFFALRLLLRVLGDLHVELLLLGALRLLQVDRLPVRVRYLEQQLARRLLLLACEARLLLLRRLELLQHLHALLLPVFVLPDALQLSFFDLFDDDLRTLSLGLLSLLFALLLDLEVLETLDFHHEVELLFLLTVLRLENLLLLELFVTDRDALGVQKHRVHLLHVILFFVERIFSLASDVLLLLARLFCELVRHLVLAVAVHLYHLLLASLCCGELLLLLLLHELFVLDLLLLGSDDRVVLNSVKLGLWNDDRIGLSQVSLLIETCL